MVTSGDAEPLSYPVPKAVEHGVPRSGRPCTLQALQLGVLPSLGVPITVLQPSKSHAERLATRHLPLDY